MVSRGYRSEKRDGKALRTRSAILKAARDLVATGLSGSPSVGAVAAKSGVSRLTVYSHFGSKQGLLDALVVEARGSDGRPDRVLDPGDPKRELERILADTCSHWASDPSLFRRLPPIALSTGGEAAGDRRLAERLAAKDELRAGCSIKEAEDVIALLTSFPAFAGLHQDGRRSDGAVAGILTRLAAAILA
jgi:AcrR family transcriptional regulator